MHSYRPAYLKFGRGKNPPSALEDPGTPFVSVPERPSAAPPGDSVPQGLGRNEVCQLAIHGEDGGGEACEALQGV